MINILSFYMPIPVKKYNNKYKHKQKYTQQQMFVYKKLSPPIKNTKK